MEHIMPQSHLALLQAILAELIKARDPEATFVDPRDLELTPDES